MVDKTHTFMSIDAGVVTTMTAIAAIMDPLTPAPLTKGVIIAVEGKTEERARRRTRHKTTL